jgi:uncharacterized protein YecT (DUF1311 family)
MKIAIFIVSMLVAGGGALADQPSSAMQDCDAVVHSASAFHACYAANLAAANKTLDGIYRSLMDQSVFYVGSRDTLRDVERAWVVYKEKECAYEYGTGGNEDYWLAHADCEIRVTEQRIRELQGRPSCTGGDSICTPHMR